MIAHIIEVFACQEIAIASAVPKVMPDLTVSVLNDIAASF
jgi:hypothetical protein